MNIHNKGFRISLMLFLLAGMMLQGCIKDKCNMSFTYMEYSPVYMSMTDFKSAVKVTAPQDLKNPGKIYLKDDFLFVNEIAKGLHIFDNSNPESPVPVAFINVPGNYDIAAKCDNLYLDSSTDLLVFNISNPANPTLIQRIDNALPHIINYRGYTADPDLGVVIEWTGEMKTVPYDCENSMPDVWLVNQISIQEDNAVTANTGNTGTRRTINPATPGTAGSMSRFAVKDEHLYILTPNELKVFDAQNCNYPNLTNTVELQMWGGEAETIYTLNDLLLIGATSGMFIYDSQDPNNPAFLSNFQHVTACDPVVAENGTAYVTLRNTGNNGPCGGWTNQLDILDISNPSVPQLLRTYPMSGPQGLGITNGTLFICDGDAGLKVYDASDAFDLERNQIAHFTDVKATDVIPNDGVLIMVGEDGIVQYDYNDLQNLRKISTISVVQ